MSTEFSRKFLRSQSHERMFQGVDEVERIRAAAQSVVDLTAELEIKRKADLDNWSRQAEEYRNAMTLAQRKVASLEMTVNELKQALGNQSKTIEEQSSQINKLQQQIMKHKTLNSRLQNMFLESQQEGILDSMEQTTNNFSSSFMSTSGTWDPVEINIENSNHQEKQRTDETKNFLGLIRTRMNTTEGRTLFDLIKNCRSYKREDLLHKGALIIQGRPDSDEMMTTFRLAVDSELSKI
jgi:hypothetical protein